MGTEIGTEITNLKWLIKAHYLTKCHRNNYASLHCLNCGIAGLFHKTIEIL